MSCLDDHANVSKECLSSRICHTPSPAGRDGILGRQVKKRYYELALEYHPDKGKELDDLDGVPFGKSKIKCYRSIG